MARRPGASATWSAAPAPVLPRWPPAPPAPEVAALLPCACELSMASASRRGLAEPALTGCGFAPAAGARAFHRGQDVRALPQPSAPHCPDPNPERRSVQTSAARVPAQGRTPFDCCGKDVANCGAVLADSTGPSCATRGSPPKGKGPLGARAPQQKRLLNSLTSDGVPTGVQGGWKQKPARACLSGGPGAWLSQETVMAPTWSEPARQTGPRGGPLTRPRHLPTPAADTGGSQTLLWGAAMQPAHRDSGHPQHRLGVRL